MTAMFELQTEVPESQRLFLDGVKIEYALQLWREESCAEFTGGRHAYMLAIESGAATLYCDVCRKNPVENDLDEYVYFEPIPVDVSIQDIVYPGGPWGGTEYDVEVEVTRR